MEITTTLEDPGLEQQLIQLLQQEPRNAQAAAELGEYYTSLGDLHRAAKPVAWAYRLAPDWAFSLYMAAWLASEQEDWARALELCQLFNQRYPQDHMGLRLYGWVTFHHGDQPTGLMLLHRAAARAPECLEVATDLMLCHGQAGNIQRATQYAHQVLALDPQNQLAQNWLNSIDFS